ncbi:hypothetical protein ANN_06462 [Periplaneta americana]|uniref:Uncharacterized protein n=1 Tax=Periplaneta americana TaxID=6978 RepID=A0ABQ8TFN3_PERAM|nr:hypothetical protein ANN_06462 [Periplaneta americana]
MKHLEAKSLKKATKQYNEFCCDENASPAYQQSIMSETRLSISNKVNIIQRLDNGANIKDIVGDFKKTSEYCVNHWEQFSQHNSSYCRAKYIPKNLILKHSESLFLSQSESPSSTTIQKNR